VDYEEADSAISRIIFGGKVVEIEKEDGKGFDLVVKPLSSSARVWVDFIYDKYMKKALNSGLLKESAMLAEAMSNGVWVKEDDESINLLKRNIEEASKQDVKDLSNSERNKFSNIVKISKKRLEELEMRKAAILHHSAEKYAQEWKIKAIVFRSCYNLDNKSFWSTWEEFIETVSNDDVFKIAGEIFANNHVDAKKIRALARHPIWRNKWIAAKAVGGLFDKPIVELTDEQHAIIYWSSVYDNVYDAYERPSDEVIEDDDKLDAWLEDQAKKSKESAKTRHIESGSAKIASSRIMKHGEVFIAPWKNRIDVGEINDLNSEVTKKYREWQGKKIKEAGVVKEQDLRATPDSRRIGGSEDNVVSVKRGRDGRARKNVDQVLPGGTLIDRRKKKR